MKLNAPIGRAQVWIGTLIFTICLFLRSPRLFVHPRFWAEEASLYADSLQPRDLTSSLFFVANSNYQILTNLVVKIFLSFPIKYAAYISTFAGFVFAIICCAAILQLMKQMEFRSAPAYVFCCLLAWCPSGYEVFLNSTNLQWTASVLVFFLCFYENKESLYSAGRLTCIFLLGLSGPPACIASIVYFAWFLVKRNVASFLSLAALGAATAIQAAVIITHKSQMVRPFHFSLDGLVAYAMQALFVNFVPGDLLDRLGYMLRLPDAWSLGYMPQLLILAALCLTAIAAAAAEKVGVRATLVIILGSFLISLINIFGALSEPQGMLGGVAGARYMMIGATGILFLVTAGMDSPNRALRLFARGLAIAIVCNFIFAINSKWSTPYQKGPAADQQIQACGARRPCRVMAWPGESYHVDFN